MTTAGKASTHADGRTVKGVNTSTHQLPLVTRAFTA
jgi:hypothetical protein